ncbi:MAG: glycosyl hydrolase 53 family protein [Prevotella sp.]|nr:glycosyl hydrolase 53 family protein [Prevotella sp.]
MKKVKLLLAVALLLCAGMVQAQKYVGGDISMLKKFVDEGAVYNDKDGNAVEPLAFMKQQGWNSMRVRLFVDPSNASDTHKKEGVIQDLEYVKALGKSIKDAGLSFMLDFHYSDTWTDPGSHATPAAWKNMTVTELTAQLYTYTKDCLQQLKAAGATPDFIQAGNEITTGMLWNTGRIYAGGGAPAGGSWDNFAGYLASATKACREECPEAQIVIHTELHAPADVPKFYNQLANYPDVDYDIIGLSYYPDYHGDLNVLSGTLVQLEGQHPDKQIMIVETGYGFEWQLGGATQNFSSTWPITEEGQREFTEDLITMLNGHARVNGLYWWYPEYTLNNIVFKNGSEDWSKNFTSGYWNAALFHYKTGKALAALYELKNFAPTTGISSVERDVQPADGRYYTLDGRTLDAAPTRPGLYIHNGHKVIVK